MKIGPLPEPSAPLNAPAPQPPAGQGAQRAAAAGVPAQQPAAAGVPVTVSKLARTLGQAEVDPDVDASRVASVRAAIEGGTYKVNPEAIADKLLANAQEMLNRAAGKR